MFNINNSLSFGQYLKSVRKKLKLTQIYIQEKSGINSDTIRRIEIGQVIPKYETLAVLSKIYKVDLNRKFSEYTVEPTLMALYAQLDYCLLNYHVEGIREIIDYVSNEAHVATIEQNLVNVNEVKQFKIYVALVLRYVLNETTSQSSSVSELQEALALTIPSFSIKNFSKKAYNPFELRILILYALMWSRDNQFVTSNKILLFILDYLEDLFFDEATTAKYRIKLYFNIAHNYHRLSLYEESLKYATLGIRVGQSSGNYNELYGLYFRKFTAEQKLKQPEAIESLRICLLIMKMIGNEELRQAYITSAKNQYGVKEEDLR